MSQIKKGALLNYVNIILTNIIGLVLTPFIIYKLGDSEYGIYTTVGALIGTLTVLDFGLNNTIIRFVAKYQAEKDKKAEENFLAMVMILYCVISITILIIGLFFYNYLDEYFTAMTKSEVELAKKLFALLVFNIALGLPGGAFTGICLGYEHFVFPKIISIGRYSIRSLLVFGLLVWGGRSLAIVILDTIFNILLIFVTFIYATKRLKITIKLHSFDKSYLRTILSYSIWIFVYSIVAQFQWKAGHIALGNMSAPEVLSVYAVGIMLGGYYGAFSTAISSVFVPRATQMTVANASSERLTAEMIKIGRVSLLILMYILGAFLLFGQNFVQLWVGSNYRDSWTIALMIMLAYTIPLTQGFTGPLIEAKNKVAFKSKTYLIFLVIGTIVGYFLAFEYGAIGMAAGTIAGWVVAQNIMNFFYQKELDLNIITFFKKTFAKILPSQICIVILGYLLNYIPDDGWLIFTTKAILYSILFLTIMYFFGFNTYEKGLLHSLTRKIKSF